MNIDRTQPCPHPDLAALSKNQLTPSDLSAIEAHLTHCSTCREALDATVASQAQWDQVSCLLATPPAGLESSKVVTDEYLALLTPTDNPDMLGRIGSYEVSGILGHGGMGVVFKAIDNSLNRCVAIKMLAPHINSSVAAKQRFCREARAAAAVVHEHVIAIYSVSEWQSVPYLVMPMLRGGSLQQRIDQRGPLQLRELLRIGMQVSSGLAAAHAQGLIHRDVKPSNILLEEDVDRVVLTDFGLARAIDDVRLTGTNTLVGTPQYMSPEQANDEPLDFRTDLFSLGSVLYEACTGRPAFQARTSLAVLKKIHETTPASVQQINSDIPSWFEQIISRLLEKDAANRFQTADEVCTLLQQCLLHVEQPQLTKLPSSLVKSENLFSTRIWRIVMLTTIGLSLISVSAFLLSGYSGEPEETVVENRPIAEPTAKKTAEPQAEKADGAQKFTTAREAYQVGVAFYNSRNFKASRRPFEAALKLAKDDKEMKLRVYEALLPAYRLIPEFEPFQKAAEYVIANHDQVSHQSMTRRSLLAFAYQRGQTENIVARHEKTLKTDPNNWMAVYLLSEIYSGYQGLPESVANSKRSIELLKRLKKLDAKRNKGASKKTATATAADTQRMARDKAKLARQHLKARNYKDAAKLYEEVAPLDSNTHAWNLKEAAGAWLKLKNNKQALRLAQAAEKAPPEARNDQLVHFFERSLADIFMELGEPKAAIPHYRLAIKKTKIEGYLTDTKASLQRAIEQSR